MEDNFTGSHVKQLLPEYCKGNSYDPSKMSELDRTLMERYQKLKDMHDTWDVEAYSIGNAMNQNIVFKMAFPFMKSRIIKRCEYLAAQFPDMKQTYKNK